jgi:hypothetical protein
MRKTRAREAFEQWTEESADQEVRQGPAEKRDEALLPKRPESMSEEERGN